LEEPARSRMRLHESETWQAVRAQKRVGARMGGGVRDEHELLVRRFRIDADPAQRVEVRLDRMAWRSLRQPVEMRKAISPQPMVAGPLARHGESRPQKMRECQPAP